MGDVPFLDAEQVDGFEAHCRAAFAELIELDFLVAPARDGLLDASFARRDFEVVDRRTGRRTERRSGHGARQGRNGSGGRSGDSRFKNGTTRKCGHGKRESSFGMAHSQQLVEAVSSRQFAVGSFGKRRRGEEWKLANAGNWASARMAPRREPSG